LGGAIVSLIALLATVPAQAAVYDLVNLPFLFFDATDVEGTLETSVTGTFTTEADIENFFNSALYSVRLKNGATTVMELNNGNSSWDLRFEQLFFPGGQSAILTSTPTEIRLDFSTPNEISSAGLFLGAPPALVQYSQSNNASDFAGVAVDHEATNVGIATLPYDDPFIFPVQAAVPEPSTILLLGAGAFGLLGCFVNGAARAAGAGPPSEDVITEGRLTNPDASRP